MCAHMWLNWNDIIFSISGSILVANVFAYQSLPVIHFLQQDLKNPSVFWIRLLTININMTRISRYVLLLIAISLSDMKSTSLYLCVNAIITSADVANRLLKNRFQCNSQCYASALILIDPNICYDFPVIYLSFSLSLSLSRQSFTVFSVVLFLIHVTVSEGYFNNHIIDHNLYALTLSTDSLCLCVPTLICV